MVMEVQPNFLTVISQFVDVLAIGDFEEILPGIEVLKKDQLIDFCVAISHSLPRPSKKSGQFGYVGNSSLSGLAYPCQMFDCRSKNISTILSFAAAYSDEIVLFDPFVEIARSMVSVKGRVPRRLVMELSFHVRQILTARPLIERGICVFESPVHENYCSDCFAEAISIVSRGKDFESDPGIFVSLMGSYARNSLVTFDGRVGDAYVYRASPSGELSDHDIFSYSSKKVSGSHPKKGGQLTPKQVVKLGIAQRFAHFSSYDVIGASRALTGGTRNSIVSSPQMTSLIEYFGEQNFTKNVSVDYPLVSQGNLDSILKIRDQEWHHLSDFRNLVDGGISSGLDVTAEIKASSDRIDRLLLKNARTIDRGLLKDALISSTGIAATVLTSGVSGILAAAAGVVSAGHLARDLIPKLVDRFSEPEAIRDEKAYYVWKLRKA